jgi:hypothetical protein
MFNLDIESLDRQAKRFNRALEVACEIDKKLKCLPYDGYIEIFNWSGYDIFLRIKDDSLSIDYVCGIVAEIEMLLGIEDMDIKVIESMKRVEHHGYYDGHPFEIYYFPSNGCHWVESGEYTEPVNSRKKMKLICD